MLSINLTSLIDTHIKALYDFFGFILSQISKVVASAISKYSTLKDLISSILFIMLFLIDLKSDLSKFSAIYFKPVSYTHLRAHET